MGCRTFGSGVGVDAPIAPAHHGEGSATVWLTGSWCSFIVPDCLPAERVTLCRRPGPRAAELVKLHQSGIMWQLEGARKSALGVRVFLDVRNARAVHPHATLSRRKHIGRRGRCRGGRRILDRPGRIGRGWRKGGRCRIANGRRRLGEFARRCRDGQLIAHQRMGGTRGIVRFRSRAADQRNNDHRAGRCADRSRDSGNAKRPREAWRRREIAPFRMEISSRMHDRRCVNDCYSESRQSAEALVRTDTAFNGHDLAASIIPRHAEMIGSDEANTVVSRRAV